MAASAFAARRAAPAAMAGINITPLVDVMLVLLVIFMVTMPIRTDAVSLRLPGMAPPTTHVLPIQPVRLLVQSDGSALLDGSRIEARHLGAELRAQYWQVPDVPLALEAVDDAAYDAFAQALAAARNAGFRDILIRR